MLIFLFFLAVSMKMPIFALSNHQNVKIMKKSVLTMFAFLLSILLTVAAPVDEQSARKIASDFMRSKMPQTTRTASSDLTRAKTGVADGEDAGFYVFNIDKGFVVVSANDELPSVLAYGLSKPYDDRTAPPAMKAMLEAYHHEATNTFRTRAAVPTHSKSISPLINSKWDQNMPYNMYCPLDELGENCPTGCVATAMAQIMYYHKWPASFDWESMKNTYTNIDTLVAGKAVANLMKDIGDKVFMNYERGGSGAHEFDAVEALRNEYGYSETTELVERECYTARTWDELIYNELQSSRPVFYTALSASSGQEIAGHAFVIDGYDAKDGVGYFHVNWGWGGYSDDYFLISVLNPQYQYTGGNAGSSGYSFDQSAIIGIEKGEMPAEKTLRIYTSGFYLKNEKDTYTRSSTSVNFPAVDIAMNIFNMTQPAEARHYDIAVALYQDRKQVAILDSVSLKDYITGGAPLEYLTGRRGLTRSNISFGKDLADGTYQLRLLSRETGKKQWKWAMGAACRYIELQIAGLNMTTVTYGKFDEEDISSFTINSVTVSDPCNFGEPITITVNLTDKNKTGNAPIFLYGNASIAEGADKFQFLTGGGTNLDPGETGDIVLEYTPQRSGKFVFYLSGNSEELTDSLYRFEVTVTGLALTMELDVEGATHLSNGLGQVVGTTLKGTLRLSNYGTESYNNTVTIRLAETPNLNTVLSWTDKKVEDSYNIGIGNTKDIPFRFENLTPTYIYAIIISVINGKETKYLNMDDNGISYIYIFQMLEDTAIKSVQLEAPDADVYDMRGVRLGKASELKNLPKGLYIINKKKVINK